jgi:hypothetical protein
VCVRARVRVCVCVCLRTRVHVCACVCLCVHLSVSLHLSLAPLPITPALRGLCNIEGLLACGELAVITSVALGENGAACKYIKPSNRMLRSNRHTWGSPPVNINFLAHTFPPIT